MNPPQITLKIINLPEKLDSFSPLVVSPRNRLFRPPVKLIVLIHFILTTWASMNGFLGQTYVYMNFFILSVGMWSIAHHDSSDTVLMYLVCQIFSILQDIILLGLYEPDGYRNNEQPDNVPGTQRNVYRFALGMSIVNLIIKPVTSFLIYRIYKERGGSYADFNLPSHLPNFGGGGGGHHGGNYENIDEPVPPNNAHIDDHPTAYNEQDKVPQH